MSLHTVLLWQIDHKLVEDFSRVSGQRTKQRAVAVHHNEAKLAVVGKKCRQSLDRDRNFVRLNNPLKILDKINPINPLTAELIK